MTDGVMLSRNLMHSYNYLSLSTDAFRLLVYLHSDADDYGIVDVCHIMYVTRAKKSALEELFKGKFITALDKDRHIVFIADFPIMNRKYDIRYMHPSPHLKLLSDIMPNLSIVIPVLTKTEKNNKITFTRKKSSCLAKEAVKKWLDLAKSEENYNDMAILLASDVSDTTQLMHDNTLSPTQETPDEDPPPIQQAPDGDPPPIQRAPDEDPPPIQRAPDEDPPPIQRAAMDKSNESNPMQSDDNKKNCC